MPKLKSIDDLKPAPYNPREIDTEAFDGLQVSVKSFGDLSSIVYNSKTGNLVCGHQRLEALKTLYCDELKIKDNVIVTPTGETFPIRIVDFTLTKEKAANVAANNQHISGTYTPEVEDIIADIRLDLPDLSKDLRFDMLVTPDFQPTDGSEQGRLDEKTKTTCPECGHEF